MSVPLTGAAARLIEYSGGADPAVPAIPFSVFPAALWSGRSSSGVVDLDLSKSLQATSSCTSPNLLASFVRILPSESVETSRSSTSHVFYVIRGSGRSNVDARDEQVTWSMGDLFTVPACSAVRHTAILDAALYWVCDAPLLAYLGVVPERPRFTPTLYTAASLTEALQRVCSDPGWRSRNRNGILLGVADTTDEAAALRTLTLTHTLWALYNALPAHTVQRPHRHNSVALDLCVAAGANTYTLMADAIDSDGNLVEPIIRADWCPGAVFVTPPGMWHSHHNESDIDAIVLPVQDAGLHTAMRTLMIQFAPAAAAGSSK